MVNIRPKDAPRVTSVAAGDTTLLDGDDGVRSIEVDDLLGGLTSLALPTRYWQGYQHSNNVSTPNTKIDLAAGSCRDSTDAINIVNIAGTIDCATIGAANGLDAGALGRPTTVTITNASPGVVTWTAHGFVAGQTVAFSTTGALPTGLTAGTTYYVIASGLATDTFQVSATLGGSAINTSSAGSGTHTGTASLWYYTFGIVKADGTSALLASASPTAPTLPATYTKFRRVGSFLTDPTAHILPFTHINNKWTLATSPRDYNAIPTLDTNTPAILSVPRVLGVVARFAATAFCSPAASTASTAYVYPGFMTSTAKTGFSIGSWANTNGVAQASECQVDSSGRVNILTFSAGTDPIKVVIDTAGWQDDL